MAQHRGRYLLIVLAIIAVGSLWRTVSVEREKRNLADAYEKARQLVNQLGTERSQLSDELKAAQGTIEGKDTDLKSLQDELTRVHSELNDTGIELASIRREHEQLREHNASLNAQIVSIETEKQQLEAKLSSIAELRLAIRDVKRKMGEERWAAWRARIEAAKAEDRRLLAEGNRGYVVRDGVPTLGESRHMHVHVLEPHASE